MAKQRFRNLQLALKIFDRFMVEYCSNLKNTYIRQNESHNVSRRIPVESQKEQYQIMICNKFHIHFYVTTSMNNEINM